MNLANITLREINQTKKKKKGQISRFHLFEILRTGKFIEIESKKTKMN